jgi:uncharacterized membrane protein YfcA
MEFLGYAASILIGISLGLIGSGGSILTVPVLVYLFHINPLLATSYSLCIVGVSSIAGVISRLRQKLLDFKVIFVFGIPSVIGLIIARKFILHAIPEHFSILPNILISNSSFIMLFFASLMFSSSLSMIFRKVNEDAVDKQPVALLKLASFGISEGMVTGIVGAGGGFLIIPALALLGKLPIKKAIASSLFIITLKSLVGFCSDLSHIHIAWNAPLNGKDISANFLLVIVTLATIGMIIGNYLNKIIDGTKLKKGFGWFVFLMSIIIVVKQFF